MNDKYTNNSIKSIKGKITLCKGINKKILLSIVLNEIFYAFIVLKESRKLRIAFTISEKLENRIRNVESYIENSKEKVYILDSDAALYNIPIDTYNKDFDMFNKGNLGGKGEQGQIEKIQNMSNIKILIRKDGLSRNWQTPEEVRKYIKENLEKQESIEIFDVYYKE